MSNRKFQSTVSLRSKNRNSLTGSISIQRFSAAELDGLKKEYDVNYHTWPLADLSIRFGTDLQRGLTSFKALQLLQTNGPNCLVTAPPKSKWILLAMNLFGGFSSLLWLGAALSLTGFLVRYYRNPKYLDYDHLYLASVLVFVVTTTGFFSYYQQTGNNAIMESFGKIIPRSAIVVRDGLERTILVDNIVVGDIVKLNYGECVPADIRITHSNGMKVDNSPITGESEFQKRSNKCTDMNPLESENMVFFGTNIVEGSGEGVVVACAENTLIGNIAGLTSGLEADEMPIKKELNSFIGMITIIATMTGLFFFVTSLIIGYSIFDSAMYLIAIIIANVPEGMPVTLSACLTLTAKKMSSKNCLVKNLQSIETLGSCNVICSDKTGTLTQNVMTVSHLYYNNRTFDVLDVTEKMDTSKPTFEALCRIGILCTRAEFKTVIENNSQERVEAVGDATECAVLKAMERIVGGTREYRNLMPKVCEIPFTSEKKYQISVHLCNKPQVSYVIVMKGAPEIVIDHCATYLIKGAINPMTYEVKKSLTVAIAQLGYMGERVVGFADLELPSTKYPESFQFDADKGNFPLVGLRFVGLMSMIDPPRPTVPDAVEKCKTAGIRVIMVTGDHPLTAVAIARKVGIINHGSETIYDVCMRKRVSESKLTSEDRANCTASVVTGADLRKMTQQDIDNILVRYKEIVFARTSPQQKLKIVESLQRLGSIVAVTGDGVNDSPALKKADIGVAMGISGADVSRNAADMILLDDNFASIVTGIEEGRLVYDNLKKSIAYVLTSNVAEVIPFISFVVLDTPKMCGVLTVILIDVGTDLWPAISLAYEKPEADIMARHPRDAKVAKLVNSRLLCLTYLQIGMIQTCAGFTTWFFLMAIHGFFYDRILGIRKDWDNMDIEDLEDSYGNAWTYEQRKSLERKGYAAYFSAIVLTQIADAIISKTRKLSIFQQGMSNWVLNWGLVFVACLTCFTIYTPGLNRALSFEPIELYILIPAIPFALFIIVFDEIRKWILRNHPDGWVARETYY